MFDFVENVQVEVGWLDWICLTTTHVLQDILAVLHKEMCLRVAFIL